MSELSLMEQLNRTRKNHILNDKTVTLGVHSNSSSDNAPFVDGHAWISVTKHRKTKFYGLWPDDHGMTKDNGKGSDIRVGLEGTMLANASRYYKLSSIQALKLDQGLKRVVTWRYTNTCASWASELLHEITGVDIDADDWAGFETPRELGKHILALEKSKGLTSKRSPAQPALRGSSL